YKFNALHLHLTDDQGWRIEIKSWPKLTEVGGSTEVGGGEGGFYTQEEYSEIVNYAGERFIMIIPEIDVPGHTNAALVSYPELNCNPKDPNPKLYTGIEVGFSTLCTDKEVVYQFMDDVIREVAAITAAPYFHIGGDESHATAKEDYVPFIERMQEIVHKHGKVMVGWDEIVNAKLDQSSIPQFWDSEENAKAAVAQNTKVIMSPAKRVYLDMQYDSTTQYGLHWAAYIEVDDSYNWEPTTYTEGIGREDIFGIETPLWSETVTNIDEAEYMIFPRLPGIAEIAWSPAEVRDWETYKVRLGKQKARFEAMDINYYPSERVPWQ
ncbi:MAG: family 20 glycosylhydrolase, partial [Bacteroidota bacterium]